jgi:uncharacterized protein (TIGR02757 family)
LIAASLAYGRVEQILKSVSIVLGRLGYSPHQYILSATPKALIGDFSGFTHRFANGSHVAALLMGIKQVLKAHGSLYTCFLKGIRETDDTVFPGLVDFVRNLTVNCKQQMGHLVPDPQKGSACKRLNLYLRWMVRSDSVDLGEWEDIPVSKLIIPLDTHMHRIGWLLGFTERKQADLRTAMDITKGFRNICPEDPVRYDFALTRLGIRKDVDLYQELDKGNG